MANNAVDCKFIDFTMRTFMSPVETCRDQTINCNCTDDPTVIQVPSVCNPRNLRMIADETEGKREILVGLHLLHVRIDGVGVECLPNDCVKVRITRLLDCKDGCDPLLYTMPECYHGPGMMLRSGEYTFYIEEQIAHMLDEVDLEFTIQLILEPVTEHALHAALYNSTICHC